jgi:hypothetical protein
LFTAGPARRSVAADRAAGPRKAVAQLVVSPLAIEQALTGDVASTNTLDLVLQYVEALRAGRIDLSAKARYSAALSVEFACTALQHLLPSHAPIRTRTLKFAHGLRLLSV